MSMKLSNQGLSSRVEFIIFIKSIGFKYNGHVYYVYKEYRIELYDCYYVFYNGSEWFQFIKLDDLILFKVFNQELRSIKLKQLLR